MSTKRRRRLFAISTSLAAVVLTLVGCEIFLRVQHRMRLARIWAGVGHPPCVEAAAERELIWRLVPGRCGANARGYLDREHSLDKPAGVFRIVVIGDSVAEGALVAPEASFGSVLERLLNRDGAARYEVIKLARSGYNTRQELYLLEHEAFSYSPDLILWSYVLNDPVDTRFDHRFNQMSELYRPRSYLWYLVETAAFRRHQQRARARYGKIDWRLVWHYDNWDELTRNFVRIGELARERGVPLVFVLHPVLEEGKEFSDYSFVDLHRELRALAGRENWQVVDLLHAYRTHTPAELGLSLSPQWDDTHPNARGHQIAAEAIAGVVTALHR